MTGTMRVPRRRGAVSGILLVLLGLWGGLLPFAGPYLDFGFAPDDPWVYNGDRLQLSVLPAAATVLGGLVIVLLANRVIAMAGAVLAALGGAWFTVGGPVATLWDVQGVGAPLGTEEGRRLAEQLSGFTALGVVVVFLAALAMGRFAAGAAEAAEPAEGNPYGEGYQQGYEPGGLGPGYRPAGVSGERSTQPLAAPTFGRYSRESTHTPPDPPHPSQQQGAAPDPGDEHVAGDRRESRF
jgi:hypothetical protein